MPDESGFSGGGGHLLDKSIIFGQGLDSRLVRAGMSRADEMLVSGVGDC